MLTEWGHKIPFSGDAVMDSLMQPRVEFREPRPGFRHQVEPKTVLHRFPIKGGISVIEATKWNLCRQQFAAGPAINYIRSRGEENPDT